MPGRPDPPEEPLPIPGCAWGVPQDKAPGLAAPARHKGYAKCTPQEIAQQIEENAQAGKVRFGKDYHGRLPSALEQDILAHPDAVYLSSGKAGRFIFYKDGNVVLVESSGSGRGNVVTSYGPGGSRGESGAAIYGGSPDDPGLPVTPEMIENGQVPRPDGTYELPGTKIQ